MERDLKKIAFSIAMSMMLMIAMLGVWSLVPKTALAQTSTITYNNGVFTKALKQRVTKVTYWCGDTPYSRTSKKKIGAVYKELAALKVKSIAKDQYNPDGVDGSSAMQLKTNQYKVKISFTGNHYMSVKKGSNARKYYRINYNPSTKIYRIIK